MNKQTSGMAIVSLVFSLLFFIPGSSLIGLILGIVAIKKISKNSKLNGKGFAIAAIIIGLIVSLVQIALILVVWKVAGGFIGTFNSAANQDLETGLQACLEKKDGFYKDFCITTIIAVHADETIDPEICLNVSEGELNLLCNAISRKDTSYCEKMKSSESRKECFRAVGELNLLY
jgi:hypothetical protein